MPLVRWCAARNLASRAFIGGTDGWAAAQEHLAALSTNATHRVADSTHAGLLEDQHGSADSVRAINDVVGAVRTGHPLDTR